MSQELADQVQAIADVIERDGWHQGDFFANADDTGGCCLHGANMRATDSCIVRDHTPVIEHLTDVIEQRGDLEFSSPERHSRAGRSVRTEAGDWVSPLPYFNDHVLSSKEEVLEFLDKARIAALEKA